MSNGKLAAGISVRYHISALIAFFVYLSVVVIFTGAFTKVVGYTAYNAESNEVLYHYYYEDGEDAKKSEYEKQGIDVSIVALRSALSGKPKFFAVLIGQSIAGLITLAFIHNSMYKKGMGDTNLASFGHIKEDMLYGFKIGAIATIPSAVAFIAAILAKLSVLPPSVIAIYRFLNYQAFALGNLFFGTSLIDYSSVSWSNLLGSASLMLVLPITAGVFYILGYKNVNIFESLIYQKKVTK